MCLRTKVIFPPFKKHMRRKDKTKKRKKTPPPKINKVNCLNNF